MNYVFAFLCFLFGGYTAVADTLTLKSGSVTWQAVGSPSFMKIDGEGGKPTGTVVVDNGKATGTFECSLSDFTTGISMRDGHMKEKYLEVQKFPTATLKLDPVALGKDQAWTGQLTLKGVTKSVSGKADITASDVTATFKVSLADFPVGVPSFQGITVANDVTITVKAQAGK